MHDCFGCMHPYPAGDWYYTLHDLLGDPLFYPFLCAFGIIIGVLLSKTRDKFNIPDICIAILFVIIIILFLVLTAMLKYVLTN